MESIYILFLSLMFIFIFYSLYEMVGLKKQINRLNGIVDFLIKDKKSKKKIFLIFSNQCKFPR